MAYGRYKPMSVSVPKKKKDDGQEDPNQPDDSQDLQDPFGPDGEAAYARGEDPTKPPKQNDQQQSVDDDPFGQAQYQSYANANPGQLSVSVTPTTTLKQAPRNYNGIGGVPIADRPGISEDDKQRMQLDADQKREESIANRESEIARAKALQAIAAQAGLFGLGGSGASAAMAFDASSANDLARQKALQGISSSYFDKRNALESIARERISSGAQVRLSEDQNPGFDADGDGTVTDLRGNRVSVDVANQVAKANETADGIKKSSERKDLVFGDKDTPDDAAVATKEEPLAITKADKQALIASGIRLKGFRYDSPFGAFLEYVDEDGNHYIVTDE